MPLRASSDLHGQTRTGRKHTRRRDVNEAKFMPPAAFETLWQIVRGPRPLVFCESGGYACQNCGFLRFVCVRLRSRPERIEVIGLLLRLALR